MAEALEGEIADGETVRIPYEFDSEKKLALIGLDANQMVLVAHGLHLLVNSLKGYGAYDAATVAPVELLFHDMATIAEGARTL